MSIFNVGLNLVVFPYSWLIRGCAAVNQRKGIFVVDNTMDSFTLYCLESGQAIRSFSMGPASVPVSKQVAFSEEGKVVIGGSNNGCVHVFNR